MIKWDEVFSTWALYNFSTTLYVGFAWYLVRDYMVNLFSRPIVQINLYVP